MHIIDIHAHYYYYELDQDNPLKDWKKLSQKLTPLCQ